MIPITNSSRKRVYLHPPTAFFDASPPVPPPPVSTDLVAASVLQTPVVYDYDGATNTQDCTMRVSWTGGSGDVTISWFYSSGTFLFSSVAPASAGYFDQAHIPCQYRNLLPATYYVVVSDATTSVQTAQFQQPWTQLSDLDYEVELVGSTSSSDWYASYYRTDLFLKSDTQYSILVEWYDSTGSVLLGSDTDTLLRAGNVTQRPSLGSLWGWVRPRVTITTPKWGSLSKWVINTLLPLPVVSSITTLSMSTSLLKISATSNIPDGFFQIAVNTLNGVTEILASDVAAQTISSSVVTRSGTFTYGLTYNVYFYWYWSGVVSPSVLVASPGSPSNQVICDYTEMPPGVMVGNPTVLSGESFSVFGNAGVLTGFNRIFAFDKNLVNAAKSWACQETLFSTTTGSVIGTTNTLNIAGTLTAGIYVRLVLGVARVVKSYRIYPRLTTPQTIGLAQAPFDFRIVATNSANIADPWTVVDTRTGVNTWSASTPLNFSCSSNTTAYLTYALFVSRVADGPNCAGSCAAQEIMFFTL